jgi:hypothetical protein
MKHNPFPSEPPQLDPPGAGLPLPNRWIARFFAPLLSARADLEQLEKSYERATQDLIRLVESLTPEQRMTRVFVPKQPGLEDSSRYWSVQEALNHLLIVSRSVEGVIEALAKGETPPGMGDPGLVKPKENSESVLADFKAYAPGLYARLRAHVQKQSQQNQKPGFESTASFPHAWFGPFKIKQWFWLLSIHQNIHRKQVRTIQKYFQARTREQQ